ncbi:MAG: VOC family protein [Polyangiaceae bacterium]
MRSIPEIRGLNHVAIIVRDLVTSEKFYVEMLGLAVVRRHDDDAGNARSIWVELGGAVPFVALERASTDALASTQPRPGLHCLALDIPPSSRAAWMERVRAHGCVVERETDFTFYFRDPDGTLVALSHYPVPRT